MGEKKKRPDCQLLMIMTSVNFCFHKEMYKVQQIDNTIDSSAVFNDDLY